MRWLVVAVVMWPLGAGAADPPEVLVSPRDPPISEAELLGPKTRVLGDVVRALSDWTNERYIVPAAVMKKRVALRVEPIPSRAELVTLLDGVLASNGLRASRRAVTRLTSSDDRTATPIEPGAVDLHGIRCIGDACEIDGSAMERLLGDTAALAASARIVPSVRDGVVTGFRLFSLRPSGLLATLGFENGDIVTAVNGAAITTPEAALAVYAQLRDARSITVDVERNGQPKRLTFRIKR